MISLKLVFEIKLRLKYRGVFISVLCISKVFIFDHLYMIHSILVLGYIDPPNSHFYFSFVLRRESVSKEKKIEERARERERERERERDGEEELERRATECTRSHQIFRCKLFLKASNFNSNPPFFKF